MDNEDIKRIIDNHAKRHSRRTAWPDVLDAFRKSGEVGIEASTADMKAYAHRRHNMIVHKGLLCTVEVVDYTRHTPTEDGIQVIIDKGKLYIVDTNKVK